MDTLQDYDTTIELVGSSKDPFTLSSGNERAAWELEYSDNASASSQDEEDGYTFADDTSEESRMPSTHRKSTTSRARKPLHKYRQQNRSQNPDKTHHRQIDEIQDKAPFTIPITPVSAPIQSLFAPHDTNVPALDHLWKLPDAWYMH